MNQKAKLILVPYKTDLLNIGDYIQVNRKVVCLNESDVKYQEKYKDKWQPVKLNLIREKKSELITQVGVIAFHNEIGWIERWASDGIDMSDAPSREHIHRYAIDDLTINEILNDMDGECEVEMEEIPDLQSWTEKEPTKFDRVKVPKIIDGKVIIII